MCWIWEGKIERCQNSSESDWSTVLKSVWNVEPALPVDQRVARRAQQSLDQGHPHSSSGDVDNDLHRRSAVLNTRDREQQLAHQGQPSSSRNDAPSNGTEQHKRRMTDADQQCSSEQQVPIDGPPQKKRQRLDTDQHSTLRDGGRVEEQRQHSRQGSTQVETSSSKHDTGDHGAGQLGRPIQCRALAFAIRTAQSDGPDGRGQNETEQYEPHPSRHRTILNLMDEEEHQAESSGASPSPSGTEDVGVLTAGMNTLPPPSWGDERVMLRLAQQRSWEERYHEHLQRRFDATWAPYERERAALAPTDAFGPEEKWEPDFDEAEILKLELPLEDEIWASSVLAGEDWMREILNGDESWPPQPVVDPYLWTRGEGGLLTSANLKRILQVFNLQAALAEEEEQNDSHGGSL